MRRLILALLVAAEPTSTRAATIATDGPSTEARGDVETREVARSWDTPAPRDIMLGIVSLDALVSSSDGDHHVGGRIGMDMLGARGDGPTRLACGLRLMLGGVRGFGPEMQLSLGVAHAPSDRAVFALVAPLGVTFLDQAGYAGIEGVAALGKRAHGGGFERFGIELATEISNRGARARFGIVKAGKDVGVGVGLLWQRDGDAQMFGVFLAETAGR